MARALTAAAVTALAAAAMLVAPASGADGSAAKARSASVIVTDDLFIKDRLTVKAGTKVTWRWQGGFLPHNVTVKSGPKKFHSRTQTSGSFARVLSAPGVYRIECTIHAVNGMKMTIVVKR